MEGLLQLQFLTIGRCIRWFDVDAWSWNLQLIQESNGLEFEDSAAAKL